ncbi:MAG: S-layer protein [Gemmatimonadetes bacterium]|nr:S-layer protein [Gemmatimonadota bacterium]
MNPRLRCLGAPAVIFLVMSASGAAAQQGDSSKGQMLLRLDSLIADAAAIAVQVPTTAQMVTTALRAQPGSSSGSVSAWGASWGDVFFGGGYQSRARYTRAHDGSLSAGFGLGSPTRDLGLEVVLNSASTFRQGVGTNGSVSLKIHRVLPGAYGVAVGFENAANWGGTDGGASVYGVVSHTVQMRENANDFFGSLAWNAGVGNSRYLPERDLLAGKKGVNAFGSVGLRIHERASLIGDWTGQDLAAGLSLVPFRRSPLVVSVGLADLTHTAGDGARLVIGAGMGLKVSDLLGRNH